MSKKQGMTRANQLSGGPVRVTVFELRAATAYASYRHMSKKKLLKTTKSVKIKLMEFKLLCVIFFSFFVPFFLLHTRARGASIRSCFTVRSLVSLYARTHKHTHTTHTYKDKHAYSIDRREPKKKSITHKQPRACDSVI